ARSDLHACFTQGLADRLDSEPLALHDPVAVGVDVVDDHRDRNLALGYLILRSSSAAAQNAAEVLRISFVRFSSRTCCSSSAIRCASAVVVPGRTPPSISACRTQLRSVSGCIPSCSATRAIAPGFVAGSCLSSTAN